MWLRSYLVISYHFFIFEVVPVAAHRTDRNQSDQMKNHGSALERWSGRTWGGHEIESTDKKRMKTHIALVNHTGNKWLRGQRHQGQGHRGVLRDPSRKTIPHLFSKITVEHSPKSAPGTVRAWNIGRKHEKVVGRELGRNGPLWRSTRGA